MIRTAVLINRTLDGDTGAWVAGLSLPARAVLAAQHVGIEEILILGGDDPARWLAPSAQPHVRWLGVDAGTEIAALRAARAHLREPFVVLFGDSVVEPKAMAALRQSSLDGHLLVRVQPQSAGDGAAASSFLASPELLARLDTLPDNVRTVEELWARCSNPEAAVTRVAEGRTWERVNSKRDLARIERELAECHLKPTDGIFARFNKTVVARPLIRFFLRTPATPNFISVIGLVLGLLSGAVFALGGYGWSLLGALLAYASAIMDHVDGMVARLKFQQSDFGTWFESAVDYVSYLAVFIGLAIGLYRETRFTHHLLVGALFVFGAVTNFIVQSRQRKQISGDKPADYALRIHERLEQHSDNFFHFVGRKCGFLGRRAVLPYFIFLFCLADLRTLFLGWSTLAANMFWILTLYNNRLLTRGSAPK